MITTEFLHNLDRLSIILKKKVVSSFSGERPTEFLGSGLLFRDYSQYVEGDDFKHIDWRIYGRTEKLYVKRFEEDRNLTVHIILDYSGSMNFGTKIKKYEYAGMIGLGFAYLALRNNENFVLSTFDDTLDFFKPRKGKAQIAAILDYLNHKKPQGLTKFEDSLEKYKQLIHSKSLIIIISDFFYEPEAIKNFLHRFHKNKIKLVQVLDPVETDLKLDGDYNLVDLESSEKMHTFIDPYLRKQYLETLNEHNKLLTRTCDENRADFYSVHSGESIFDVFYKILN